MLASQYNQLKFIKILLLAMSITEPPPDTDQPDSIAEYVRSMRQIKAQAAASIDAPISGTQFDEYVLKHFFPSQHARAIALAAAAASTPSPPAGRWRKHRNAIAVTVVLVLVLIAPLTIAAVRQHLASLFMMHIQTLIHPGMSWWRTLTLPLLTRLPALSALYDESCLLPNPFFHITGMDCRPCADVHAVLDFGTAPPLSPPQSPRDEHRPHVFRDTSTATATDAPAVTVERLHELYANHTRAFRADAYAVRSSNARIRNLDELFAAFGLGVNGTSSPTTTSTPTAAPFHALWRCNRMNPLRLLRRVIRRPAAAWLPRTGMHIERYVAVDTRDAPAYRLPDMECARVFVAQLAGARNVVLRPSGECAGPCRTVSVRLEAGSVCK